ncbi:TonB-dependent receptor plug domain-containing protein [Methylomonas sp. 11b]|uniref:TonB-dependent receptor plug domain-containing protein n=1 Tax=Methylomonas sp. 11b TaxID=1168169 RepID=UPI0018CC426D|nr:TonB-dependent receptor [Methylomonas sp. 11b]
MANKLKLASKNKRLALFCITLRTAAPAGADDTLSHLKTLSLQELSASTVSIASKNQQPISETPSAVFVISHEEIRRSGMQSIPELLRKVPGLEVARVDGNQWAISSRGFNGINANKLLVMMDGRTVYDPLNSGVYWNEQDYPLEDIDRIEVIRGPGATLWGSNAVNGVINIVTRSAQESQGVLLSGGTSKEEPGFGTFRYGGQLSPDFNYRVYGKYNHREAFHFGNGEKANDSLDMGRAGFRSDWTPDPRKNLIVQGDYFNGDMQQSLNSLDPVSPISPDSTKKYGGNLLLRWQQTLENDSRLQIRSYFDHAVRNQSRLDYRRSTFDLDLQHDFNWHAHHVTWGAGYRFNSDQLQQKQVLLHFDPSERDVHLFNVFAQDEWRFLADELRLIYGSKVEHNDFTGFEIQPSARLLWVPNQQHSLWGAVSRAVRVPARADHDVNVLFNVAPGTTANIMGDDNFDSESAVTYELGYRFFPNDIFNLDTTLFYSDYGRLSTTEPQTPLINGENITIPFLIANKANGEAYGWETALNWRLSERWRLQGSYSLFAIALHQRDGSLDSAATVAEGNSARNRFNLSSYFNLPYQLEFDAHWYYTDHLINQVSAYHRLDLRLGWQPNLHFELAVGAQNLLDNRHLEFSPNIDNAVISSEFERNYYLKATVRY